MPFHKLVVQVLLLHWGKAQSRSVRSKSDDLVPDELKSLHATASASYRQLRNEADAAGDRYRSAFWAIYLLSALAVLCAALPIALQWDVPGHPLGRLAGMWGVLEIAVIGTVAWLYHKGNKSGWREKWLHARAQAELTHYLPVLAPLVNFDAAGTQANWYERVFNVNVHGAIDATGVKKMCGDLEPQARTALAAAWHRPDFGNAYGRWVADVLARQVVYQSRVNEESHRLNHNVHAITEGLFVLTALAALAHLFIHSAWLTVATVFFPALGAALHGALFQSESSRMELLSGQLKDALTALGRDIDAALAEPDAATRTDKLKAIVGQALTQILEEHEGWHMLVRPHSLPIA